MDDTQQTSPSQASTGASSTADTTKMMVIGAAVLVAIGLVGAVAYWYINSRGASTEVSETAQENDSTTNISNATRNPAENLQNTNPFGRAQTNPYETYRNPFE